MDTAQTQDESLVEKAPGLACCLIFPCNLKLDLKRFEIVLNSCASYCDRHFKLSNICEASLISKDEGRLWPHNETALQMRDKVGALCFTSVAGAGLCRLAWDDSSCGLLWLNGTYRRRAVNLFDVLSTLRGFRIKVADAAVAADTDDELN